MMNSIIGFISLVSAAQVAASRAGQDNIQLIAQALDRCMTTYAVRMTHTDATDEAIFAEATRECSPLNNRLKSAVNAQVPAPQASEFIATLDAQAKPNFLKLLAKIRSDRAAKGEH